MPSLDFLSGKKLIVIIIGMGILTAITVLYMSWYNDNVLNPRIWEGWSCEEMKRFALEFKNEELTYVQQAKFHNDLILCMK